ncbi:uncharacterized protein si:ch211-191i18.4 isoform X2 [Mugil cephalus]|uniref:uncharacterized protein si:ch211-191i18.4 isoform X2 n=1 Tax=Mugil cephalus TaxID=48193 RepID=UPI001FB62EFD|nr:uncharacterized protein si:ch211-191i18.4 isoform X2 [Mugil cephalus]
MEVRAWVAVLLLISFISLEIMECSLPDLPPPPPPPPPEAGLQEASLQSPLEENVAARLPGLCRRLKRRRVTVLVTMATRTSPFSLHSERVFNCISSSSVTWRSSAGVGVGGGAIGVRGVASRVYPVRCVAVHAAPGVHIFSSTASEPGADSHNH